MIYAVRSTSAAVLVSTRRASGVIRRAAAFTPGRGQEGHDHRREQICDVDDTGDWQPYVPPSLVPSRRHLTTCEYPTLRLSCYRQPTFDAPATPRGKPHSLHGQTLNSYLTIVLTFFKHDLKAPSYFAYSRTTNPLGRVYGIF